MNYFKRNGRGPAESTAPDLGCNEDSGYKGLDTIPQDGFQSHRAKERQESPNVYSLKKEAQISYEISAANDS